LGRLPVAIALLLAAPLAAFAAEWSWSEGKVDARTRCVVLLYGPADADPQRWAPVARVCEPRGTVFPVEWMVDAKARANRAAVQAVSADLDFYLKGVGGPDPWSYVQYHCGTTSNWFGDVHWACP
jgi:hypothetical protein